MGVDEPEATFSACFGAAFLVMHPAVYAEMLAANMKEHGTTAWLINTGWTGGAYGTGERMNLPHTRAIIDAIHDRQLADVETVEDAAFGLAIPQQCPGCPPEVLVPRNTWADVEQYDQTARQLAELFHKNFQQYADEASEAIRSAGPKIEIASS